MSGYEITWNGISSTTIPEFGCEKITRSLLGGYRGRLVDIPGRAGSVYFPEQRGRKKISLDCYVLSSGAIPISRREAVTEVADWLDINAQAQLVLGDAPDVFYNAVLLDPPDVDEWRRLGKFSIEFSADPYAYDIDATIETFSQDGNTTWPFDFGLTVQTYPVIEVKNVSGAPLASGFSLSINGYEITYANPISNNSTVTINSIGMAVLAGVSTDSELTGAYNPASQVVQSVTGQFPILSRGVNTLEVTTAEVSPALEIKVIYRKQYRN